MKLNSDQFNSHSNDYDGYCYKCDDITSFGGVEPDAQGYECPECDKKTLMGMDIALVLDYLDISEDEDDETA